MKLNPSLSKIRLRGFTLIELLVVIAIIGILAGLILAALAGARRTAKRAKARVQINQMGVALTAYYTEYGTWPHAAGVVPNANLTPTQLNELYWIFSGNDRDLNAVLASSAAGGNTRQIRFLEFKSTEFAVIGGFTNVVDPWGGAYQVRLDDDNDNQVAIYGTGPLKPGGFAIWSKGENLQDNPTETSGVNADNVTSWK